MIIIETCPKCGHDLQDIMLASNPPIPKKECFNCGWSWQGEPEQVIRRPFGGNSLDKGGEFGTGTSLNGSIYNEFVNMGYSNKDSLNLANLAVDTAIAYNGCIDITDATNTLINMFNKDND